MFWTQIRYARGIHLHSIDLWLDPHSSREWAFVSHAHSDHIATHQEVILSEGTYRFLRQRKRVPKLAAILPFHEPRTVRGVEVTLYPAGHVMGSAQLLAAVGEHSVLYSGDFKLGANCAAEPIQVPRAEVLVMETTYGHARYAFPPAAEVVTAITGWCDTALADGVTPVLLGYSLGKAQEVLASLAGCGYRILVHDSIYQLCRIAEELGAAFPPYERWSPGQGDGCVCLFPPHLRRWATDKLPAHRAAIVSGWASDPGTRYRYGADAAFCFSDHADFANLLRYVEQVDPQRIYTVHGFASNFASELRRRGYDAHALDEPDQLELF